MSALLSLVEQIESMQLNRTWLASEIQWRCVSGRETFRPKYDLPAECITELAFAEAYELV